MRKIFSFNFVKTNNISAFSLAEVLIALLIVGIVAALSIPALMDNLTARKFRVSFIKGINSLARAATSNYGVEGYDFSGTNGYYGTVNNPVSTFNIPGGANDGSEIFGFNTPSVPGSNTFSDLHPDTPSLFHIWHDNLNIKAAQELSNYPVMPSDITLNCASRPKFTKVELKVPGSPNTTMIATIKPDFESRAYWTMSVIQGSGSIFPMCDGRTLEKGGINQGRMFQLEDGMVFTYDPAQAYCLETNPCYGYIDVNGPAGPNRMIACSEGEDSFITSYSKNALPGMIMGSCTVKTKDVTDIYPVLFYNNTVKPASWAAKSVLYSVSTNQLSAESDVKTMAVHIK